MPATQPLVRATPHFTIARSTGSIGAEIGGIDLGAPLSDAMIAAISDALVEHKVLFFRDQDITIDQHIAFAKRFGPLEIHPFHEATAAFTNAKDHPEVIRIESTAEHPASADTWHSDVTWREEPSLGSILRQRISPAYGGDTVWANMEAAYEGLDDATRAHLSGLIAIHDWHGFREKMIESGAPAERVRALQAAFPPVEHPLVRNHPVSGRKLIYVNALFTVAVKGMAKSESDALLKRLYALASVPEYQVRLRWRANTIAFWDNRSTQHYAVPDFYPQHRLMERVTIAGDRPH